MKFTLCLPLLATTVAQDVFLSNSRSVSQSDLVRAEMKKQPGRLGGSTAEEIAGKLNSHVRSVGGASKECDLHSQDELNDVMRQLLSQSSGELQAIYNRNGDARAKRFQTVDEYEASWVNEEDSETLRHSKCFEIGEMWAHHLAEGAKRNMAPMVPVMPVYDEAKTDNDLYVEASSCQTGHSMVAGGDGTSTHQWPDWPEELHYKAVGHGAYPFWWGGGSDSGDADMEVWWSEKQGAEKFYHSSCVGKGSSKGSKLGKGKGSGNSASSWLNGPCYHLMLAPGSNAAVGSGPEAYLYTADESTCCIAEPSYGETLAPAQGNFWNTFSYKGEVDFNGHYYQGKAKYYVLSGVNEPVRDFWYFTDLDGKPVQQGEAGTGPTDQGYPTSIGHTIWHDYDPASLDTSAISSSNFEIPQSCKTTSKTCAFP